MLKKFLGALCALTLTAAALATDRIELTDGSVIHGKLLSAEAGKFKVETGFAGTIEIAQDKIKAFTTDEAVNVQLAAGSTVLGKVAPTGTGIVVTSDSGTATAPADKVVAVWRAGADSPEVRKLRREWQFEAALGLSGRTGVSERFSSALAFKATLESATDKLVFAAAAEKARDNGVDTANRQYGSADYSAMFSAKNLWYVRTALERDELKLLDLRSTTAAGLGHKFIKNEKQDLEGRIGVNYLFESYSNGTDYDSPGLDVGVIHSYTFTNGKLSSSATYTPAFEDFGNYRVHAETGYEMPITASMWKLKLGVAADYTSMPQPGIEKLDILYYTSLILNWK